MSLAFVTVENGFAAGRYETLKLISASNGTAIENYGQDNTVKAIAYNEKNNLLSCGGDSGQLRVYNASTHRRVHECKFDRGRITALSFSMDGSLLAVGTDDGSLLFLLVNHGWSFFIPQISFPKVIHDIVFVMERVEKHNINHYYTVISSGQCVITMTSHGLTTTPPEVILKFQDTYAVQLIKDTRTSNGMSVLKRNHECQTLMSLTAEKKKLKLLSKMINLYPRATFISNRQSSNKILLYLDEYYLLNELKTIAELQSPKLGVSRAQLDEMIEVIRNLSHDDVQSIVLQLLKISDKSSVHGFVLAGETYLLTSSFDRSKPLSDKMDPRPSESPHVEVAAWRDLCFDEEKRVKLYSFDKHERL